MPRNLFIVIVSPFEDNFLISINHPLTNITLACAEPSLHYFQHLKLHAHVSVVFVLSPSPQCQNIGLGGGGEHLYFFLFFKFAFGFISNLWHCDP